MEEFSDDEEDMALALAMSKQANAQANAPAESEAAEKKEEKGRFELSARLGPHTRGARTAAVINDGLLATAGESGDILVWKREDHNNPSFTRSTPFGDTLQHGGLIFVLASSQGAFVSGGKDQKAMVWQPDGRVEVVLEGFHSNSVGSIATMADGKLVTGCWDGSAAIWGREGTCEVKICDADHQYGVEVCVLSDGRIVSGSSTKQLIIYGAGGPTTDRSVIPHAHDHVIRCIVPLPADDGGFVSCANDGHVKVWDSGGRCTRDIIASDSFVYSIAVRASSSGTEVVSGGEDGVLKVWGLSDGGLGQQIIMPSSVRCVRTLPNGDVLACCSDKYVYIFTKDPRRFAGGAERERFASYQANAAAAQPPAVGSQSQGAASQGIDVSKLPAKDTALASPGDKEGAIKVVAEGGKAMVYSWTRGTWTLVGEAMGAAPATYDVTVDVELGNKSFPLQFNRGDDARQVATAFCTRNSLPTSFVGQIRQYIQQLMQ